MRRFLWLAFSVAFFPVMVWANSWLFRHWFDKSYLDWYIANGSFISVIASLFVVVWKNLNDHHNLIASNPRAFLAANLELAGVQWIILGDHLQRAGARLRADEPGATVADLVDGLAVLVASVLIFVALVAWLVLVVPLQYFIILIAGAPARVALRLGALAASAPTVSASATAAEMAKWQANLLASPVSMTNGVAALVILAVKLARS